MIATVSLLSLTLLVFGGKLRGVKHKAVMVFRLASGDMDLNNTPLCFFGHPFMLSRTDASACHFFTPNPKSILTNISLLSQGHKNASLTTLQIKFNKVFNAHAYQCAVGFFETLLIIHFNW